MKQAARKRDARNEAPLQTEKRTYRVTLDGRSLRATSETGEIDFIIRESIAHLTVVTARLFDRQLANRLRTHGVPIGQWPFLMFLWADESLSQRDLSQLMAIEESTVASTIARMERDGLLERQRASDNRRRNKLSLTQKGKKLKNDLLRESRSVVEAATQDMSPVEVEFLKTLLRKVQTNLANDQFRPVGLDIR